MLKLEDIMDDSQRSRDVRVAAAAGRWFSKGQSVFDVGAGTYPYGHLLAEYSYVSHDLGNDSGVKPE